jgi:hypothetical protein
MIKHEIEVGLYMKMQDIIFLRHDKVITGAEEIGWAMLWLCCALPCCVTIILPGASMWRLAAGVNGGRKL